MEFQVILSFKKHFCKDNLNNLEMSLFVLILYNLHAKLNMLSQFMLFDTSLTISVQHHYLFFHIQIHAHEIIKWIRILIVLKNIFVMICKFVINTT